MAHDQVTRETETAEATPGRRARPRTAWPRVDAVLVGAVLLWLLGLAVAVVVPALIVPPQGGMASMETTPSEVGAAFAVTLLGIAIFTGASLWLYRHSRNSAVLVIGLIPAVSIGSGAIILTATLLAS